MRFVNRIFRTAVEFIRFEEQCLLSKGFSRNRFRERRFVAMSMAIIWILASVVALPTFWARQWDEHSQISYWNLEQTVSEVLLVSK